MIKRILKITLYTLLALILVPIIIFFILYKSADMGEPKLTINASDYSTVLRGDTTLCENSYIRYDSCGLWELYVEGSGELRGARQGALTQDLMKYQEDVFVNQIREFIPSDSYFNFLRSMIVFFNRNLAEHISLEYRAEIAAMSQFCTHEYDAIGTPYERQLNYHAAHDIGHTMQQYMLVGCSSFGTWGEKSENGSLLIGRNFDFYVGDDFARNKLITFAAPDSGYRYASVGWAGMVGVLSGMNEKGLTVTINAAKGAIPTSAATPISILTREILQYAANIDQAYAIAKSRQTFVSESILVGSANDGRCTIIEKTPERTALYTPSQELIICTNHYQSPEFATDSYNTENIENSDSKYRYDRLGELLSESTPLNYQTAAKILRNRLGTGNEDIGIGNEMTLNQSIAHHAVIFQPKERMMWVSTSPWQSGAIVAYDLNGFFDGTATPRRAPQMDIAPDTLFLQRDYEPLLAYRKSVKEIRSAIKAEKQLTTEQISTFQTINPNHYYTYRILGDYFAAQDDTDNAMRMYQTALGKSIPYKTERNSIEEIVKKLRK